MSGSFNQIRNRETGAVRLPEWLRKSETHFPALHSLKHQFRQLHLHTVCESARCPNIHECFHKGTATFMILGDVCTRSCSFCAIPKSSPPLKQELPDPQEPANVAQMAQLMKLRHVVITSVTRDDLPDGGSGYFAETVREIRRAVPEAKIEVLTPDFQGRHEAVSTILDSGPDIFNHNLETVPRLYSTVRPQARYNLSLGVLRFAKQHRPEALTKSGMMVGMGEEPSEVEEALRDLADIEVDIVTIGQYLRPTRRNLPVAEYVSPAQFGAYRTYGHRIGLKTVFSGPLVRSSYMAEIVSEQASRRQTGAKS